MSRQKYVDINFRLASLRLIDAANAVFDRYPGERLMLRELFYQLLPNTIANTKKEYEHLGRLLTDARMAGLVDWDAIEDRHRNWERRVHWESPAEILQACVESYHMDMWAGQPFRPFVVVEKDSLSGALGGVCHEYDTPLLAAKGYCSTSTLREFSIGDILPALKVGKVVVIFHLGDHDPSGLDMSRDIEERVRIFTRNGDGQHDIRLRRLGLNIDQVRALNLPPNFAKTTDRRFAEYKLKYGDESWELDALPRDYLKALVKNAVHELIDPEVWAPAQKKIADGKMRLAKVAKRFAAGGASR